MSVDVLISPRISFSHDIEPSENNTSTPSNTFPSPSIETDFDFAFNVERQGALLRESSTADDLFSYGKLLPASIHFCTTKEINLSFQDNKNEKKKIIKSLKAHLEDSSDTEDEEDQVVEEAEESVDEARTPQVTVCRTFWNFRRSSSLSGRSRRKESVPSKLNLLSRSKSTGLVRKSAEEKKTGLPTLMEDERSFWKFKRSNSLDCDKRGQNSGGLIGSLKQVILQSSNSTGEQLFANTATAESRQFRIRRSSSLNCNGNNRGLVMGRSNSTGSAYTVTEKKQLLKQNSARSSCSSSSSSSRMRGPRHGRRSFKDYYAIFYRGERVNPALNLPSPYISRATVDLLGFASLFCNGRYTKNRK